MTSFALDRMWIAEPARMACASSQPACFAAFDGSLDDIECPIIPRSAA